MELGRILALAANRSFLGLVLGALLVATYGVVRADSAPFPSETNAPLQQAERAFSSGRYDQVAALTFGQRSAKADALVAKALLAKAMLLEPEAKETLVLANAALGYARRALAKDEKLVEAHLHTAIALGLQAHHLGTSEAMDNVETAKAAIDTALALAPSDPWVQATLGGWHLTLTGKVGTLPANLMFGASRSDGLAAFDRALAADPANPKLLYHYAKVRLMQGDQNAIAETFGALDRLEQLAPKDALSRSLKAIAVTLRAEAEREERIRREPVNNYQ